MSAEPMAAAAADLAPKPPVAGTTAATPGATDVGPGGSNADFCIPAKRMKDGSVCFYVTIEHLIEQTLLRALNRPEFRKTPVVVKEDETLSPTTDGSGQPPGASDSTAAIGSEPAEQATKAFGSVPIKLQLKRKYREGATAGTDSASDGCSSSLLPNGGPSDAKRPGVSQSPPTAACVASPVAAALSPLPRVGSGRLAEINAGDRRRTSDANGAAKAASVSLSSSAATLLAPAGLFQTLGRAPTSAAVTSHVPNGAVPMSNKQLSPPPMAAAQAEAEWHRRSSVGRGGTAAAASRQPPTEYGGRLPSPAPSSQVAKLTAGVASHLQLADRFATREPTSSFTPPPQQQGLHAAARSTAEDRDLDVALDLSAKRSSSADLKNGASSVAAAVSLTPPSTLSSAGARNHSSLMATTSKSAIDGSTNSHHHHQQQQQQQAVSPAILLEHYGTHLGHMFHSQQAAAAAAAAADFAAMMQAGSGVGSCSEVKETWRQQLALTAAGWRPPPPLGYPSLPSWPMPPQPPLSLGLSTQSSGRSLAGAAAGASAAAASPTAGRQVR